MNREPLALPAGFRFGVATSGFQIEGGYNRPGEPRNNWYQWEAAGRIERSGIGIDFWNRYEEHLDRAVAAGCDAFRMSVEWTRCEPIQGSPDAAAFHRYAAILGACHDRGLQPLVTLYHFTHPAWLGFDFWLRPDSPDRFARWARTVAERLADHCRHWITINEPNIYALCSYLMGTFPPGRRLAVVDAMRALDHLLAAHVLAYAEIHARQPDAVVSINNFAYTVYHFDRMLIDLLLARRHRVAWGEVRDWLHCRRAAFDAAIPAMAGIELPLRPLLAMLPSPERTLPRVMAAVYGSPHDCTLDVTLVDYYDPVVSHHLRLPGHTTAGGRNWLPTRMLWDHVPNPEGLLTWIRANHEPGLDVWIVENGLCNRVRDGRSYPRNDGWDRARYLRANLGAVVRAIDGGVPISGYYHWTLADNYEWGSYEPRFGLYGAERRNDAVHWSRLDSMGVDAAGAYRRIIEGLRAGDRSVVA